MNISQIINVSIRIGALMLAYGAEINRVEDTISRIAEAYGAHAETFAIPGSLWVTIHMHGEAPVTQTSRPETKASNLDLVDALNALARDICSAHPCEEEILRKIEQIERRPRYSAALRFAAAALSPAAFAFLFGGGLSEALVAAVSGLLIRLMQGALSRVQSGPLLNNIVGGVLCGLFAMLAALIRPIKTDIVIISTLMLLVPGLAFTNSLRDLIAGDLVTGMMRISEALVIAAGIAIGIMLSLAMWGQITGGLL